MYPPRYPSTHLPAYPHPWVGWTLPRVALRLLGPHQAGNAALAAATLRAVGRRGRDAAAAAAAGCATHTHARTVSLHTLPLLVPPLAFLRVRIEKGAKAGFLMRVFIECIAPFNAAASRL